MALFAVLLQPSTSAGNIERTYKSRRAARAACARFLGLPVQCLHNLKTPCAYRLIRSATQESFVRGAERAHLRRLGREG